MKFSQRFGSSDIPILHELIHDINHYRMLILQYTIANHLIYVVSF